MLNKFQNRYRIASARLSNWDYSSNAAYFVTICTAYRQPYFGVIINSTMHVSKIGEYVIECWLNIPAHFPYFYLDEFVVMPNHMHGIVLIEKPFIDSCRGFRIVEIRHALSLPQNISGEPQQSEPPNYRISVFATRGKTQFQ